MLGKFASSYICIIFKSDILHFLHLKCNTPVQNIVKMAIIIPSFLVVKGSFQDMAGLPNFVLIQRTGLAQQTK